VAPPCIAVAAPIDDHARVVEHLSWMRGQYVRGTVLISGPSADALAATDPLVQDDQTSIEVIEWDVHQILGIGSFDPPLVL